MEKCGESTIIQRKIIIVRLYCLLRAILLNDSDHSIAQHHRKSLLLLRTTEKNSLFMPACFRTLSETFNFVRSFASISCRHNVLKLCSENCC